MKNTRDRNEDMLSEYEFDYQKAKKNRFSERYSVSVTLDPDVAEIFTSSESVNKALRAIISAIPKSDVHTNRQQPVK